MSDPSQKGRPEAAAVIWSWRARASDVAKRARSARLGALLRFAIAATAGAVLLYFDRAPMAAVATGAGGLVLLLALISPLGAYAAVDRFARRAGVWVGTVLTWLLLAPVFYLFMTPFGLLFRRGARDPLKRCFEPDARTYWQRRDPDRADIERPF